MTRPRVKAGFGDRILLRIARRVLRFQVRIRDQQNRVMLSRMASCGDGTALYGRACITGLDQVRLGRNVHIGDNAFIRGEGGLTIGDNTHVSRNLVLYTVNHRYEGERLPYDEELVEKPVDIGRNVWIGMNVCIAPGTTIGDGAIVAMGAVVFGDVPPLTIVGGPAWRALGQRDQNRYQALCETGAYGGADGRAM